MLFDREGHPTVGAIDILRVGETKFGPVQRQHPDQAEIPVQSKCVQTCDLKISGFHGD